MLSNFHAIVRLKHRWVMAVAGVNLWKMWIFHKLTPIPPSSIDVSIGDICHQYPRIAKLMGPTWGPPGSCRPQMDTTLTPRTLISGSFYAFRYDNPFPLRTSYHCCVWCNCKCGMWIKGFSWKIVSFLFTSVDEIGEDVFLSSVTGTNNYFNTRTKFLLHFNPVLTRTCK